EGSTIGGLMDSLGTAISVALQYGVPVESLVYKFTHQRFEPAGMTTNRDIPFAKSLVDYIFRWLGMQFIPGYREANLPNRGETTTTKQESKDASRSTAKAGGRMTTSDTKSGQGSGEKRWSTAQSTSPTDSGPIARIGGDTNPQDGTPGVAVVSDGSTQRVVHVESRTQTESIDVETAADGSIHIEVESHNSALSAAMSENMGDAPPCDVCGEITVRNGHCYKCLNCGNSLGCS
ncbi:MAG: vitamin B12-dependent ribonucleotide reductase, partial [Planctomycetota bacterium]